MSTDYSVFASPDFDPNEYANATLAGDPYPPQSLSAAPGVKPPALKYTALEPAKEDISVAISKLDFGIEDVSKQIKNVVTTHHEELLEQAAGVNDLTGSLTSVRHGLNDLDTSLDKLRQKIHIPYTSLQTHVTQLQRLQQASDVLRRTARFVVLARRLEGQMRDMKMGGEENGVDGVMTSTGGEEDEKERTIAKAALSIAELVALLDGPSTTTDAPETTADTQPAGPLDGEGNLEKDDPTATTKDTTYIPLRSVNAVAAHIPFIEDAREKVTAEMQAMVLTGLSTLNRPLLSTSLQTAANLRVLPSLVQSLVLDLSEAVEERIKSAFDMTKIGKDVLMKDPLQTPQNQSPSMLYKSRVRTEPTSVTAPQWTAALWARLENLIEEMAGCCIKVYTLEKVLKMKTDTVSGINFLDEAMKLLENKPSTTFWSSLGRSLEKHLRDSARNATGSTFLQTTLSTGYPRLLRLFHEFFAKIAVHTDTVYTPNYQSPETIITLRALSNFEALYLSRSSNRLNESVAQAFANGARAPPGMNEGINIARTVANELDSARFDPLLIKAVAKNAGSSLDMMLSRADGLVIRDRSAVTMIGPSATAGQIINGQVATCLYHCWSQLEKLEDEHLESVYAVVKPSIKNIFHAYERVVDPLLTSIRRELGAIIARLHRIDFGKSADPMSGMGGGSSIYMKDLVEKLSFIRSEILSKFNVGEAGRAWAMSIVKFVIRTFVLHMSIAKPLGESGKLQLTSDMTELEFALSAFMVEDKQSKRGSILDGVGDNYRALRAMRPLLFLENALLASPKHTAGLPPLIVLHHILVRSPVPLPHSLHGWQEAEYVRWVDEHSEEEAWTLVEGGLSHWEKVTDSEGQDPKSALEYVNLARSVLANAKSSS
ncbi:hypothetical protein PILCRDRAFT_809983 [Piloderma croceum F 1598]|uniref:Conserved oligomeric Golgi complex subunit 5 n=1 Tax=Piloderma croceum (strain F 1598) TaxID=765440 RepID=A0A0C3CQR5_PILCF|nr:hypothetical protein PILCRDRAFT_809983 [Piloderma croceum F 1598]